MRSGQPAPAVSLGAHDGEPPEYLGYSLNSYDASNYDLRGRFTYVSAGTGSRERAAATRIHCASFHSFD
jgi:hypothetical protein